MNKTWSRTREVDEFGIERVTYRDTIGNRIVRDGIASWPYTLYRVNGSRYGDAIYTDLATAKMEV